MITWQSSDPCIEDSFHLSSGVRFKVKRSSVGGGFGMGEGMCVGNTNDSKAVSHLRGSGHGEYLRCERRNRSRSGKVIYFV